MRNSFMATLVTAHRDVGDALRAMPRLALLVALLLVAQAVFDVLVVRRIIPPQSLLGHEILELVSYFLLTPFLIAVHRYIVLGEITQHYMLAPRSLRFQLFFGWLASVLVMTAIVGALPKVLGFSNPASQIVVVVAAFAVLALVTRMTILFPAIAVDAPGATWRNAVNDSKGHGWFIFFLLLVAMLPTGIAFALAGVTSVLVLGPMLGRVVLLLLASGVAVVWVTLAVVISSRLYLELGDRLKQP